MLGNASRQERSVQHDSWHTGVDAYRVVRGGIPEYCSRVSHCSVSHGTVYDASDRPSRTIHSCVSKERMEMTNKYSPCLCQPWQGRGNTCVFFQTFSSGYHLGFGRHLPEFGRVQDECLVTAQVPGILFARYGPRLLKDIGPSKNDDLN